MLSICVFSVKSCISYLFCLFSIWFLLIDTVGTGFHQKRLLIDLFKNYTNLERPVENEGQSLQVVVGMSIQQIVEFDERRQILTCSGWMDYNWTDYNLKWDPLEYGNITFIRIRSERIWVPDVLLYNSGGDSFDTTLKVNAVIEYTGNVKYVPPGMFKSTCQIDIADFPFDEQNCSLKFGSWTFDESKVNLTAQSDKAQLDSFKANGEWHLIDVESHRESINYACCVEKYPFVLFTIRMRRRTLYYIFNLIFPCGLISMMTILGFALPPDSGEKIALEITTLLSIVMFLQLISGIIPESSQSVPKIGVYFGLVMSICAIAIICNVCILVMHHKNVKIHKMSPWIKKWICIRLAGFLGMKSKNREMGLYNDYFLMQQTKLNKYKNISKSLLSNVYDETKNDFVLNDDFGILNKIKSSKIRTCNNCWFNNKRQIINYYNDKNTCTRKKSCLLNSACYETTTLKNQITSILNELKSITKKVHDHSHNECLELDWKFAAMVLDKLCLYVFTILTLGSTVTLLVTSPNFFKLQ